MKTEVAHLVALRARQKPDSRTDRQSMLTAMQAAMTHVKHDLSAEYLDCFSGMLFSLCLFLGNSSIQHV